MENWRFVENYENYLVSDKGNILSLPVVSKVIDGHTKGTNQNPGRLLKPRALPQGHQQVCLVKEGNKKWVYVHRLVAEAFIKRNRNADIVMHLDDDPSNNTVENLKWGTQLENVRWVDRDCEFLQMGKSTDDKAVLVYKEVINVAKQSGEGILKVCEILADKYKKSHHTIQHWYYQGKKLLGK